MEFRRVLFRSGPGRAHPERDKREHVPAGRAEGTGAAHEERPAGPPYHGRRQEELGPPPHGNLTQPVDVVGRRRRMTESAPDNHAVAGAQAIMAGRAVDVETLLPAV